MMTLDWDGKIRMDCSSPYANELELLQRLERSVRHEQFATNDEIEDVVDEQVLVLSLLDNLRVREATAIALKHDALHQSSHDARIQTAQDGLIDALWKKEQCGEACVKWTT